MKTIFLSLALVVSAAGMPGKHKPIKHPGPVPTESVVWASDPAMQHQKGVAISPTTVLTANHLGTPVGSKLHVRLADGTRAETTVTAATALLVQVQPAGKVTEQTRRADFFLGGDTRLLTVHPPLPVPALPIATAASGSATTVHRDGSAAARLYGPMKWLGGNGRWIAGKPSKRAVERGDSGLPWFYWNKQRGRWELLSITSHAGVVGNPWEGDGPRLGSAPFKTAINQARNDQ